MSWFVRQILKKSTQICLQNSRILPQNTIFSVPKTLQIVQTALYSNAATPTPYEVVDEKKQDKLVKEVLNQVNTQVATGKHGRLFAVVHIAGKQFKITEGDVVVIEGYWPPECGDKISLDKVMIVGASDFTLIGRPLVQKGIVKVEATIIEKTLSHTKTNFKKKRRKQYKEINFYKIPQTYLRINTVQIVGEVNNPPDVSGLETAVF